MLKKESPGIMRLPSELWKRRSQVFCVSRVRLNQYNM
jgi:hypothetical protein